MMKLAYQEMSLVEFDIYGSQEEVLLRLHREAPELVETRVGKTFT